MTAKDLRAREGMIDMLRSDNFRVLLAFFMEECPHVGRDITDATSIVRNEGKVQGYFGLLRDMRTIHISPPEPEKSDAPKRLYQDPFEAQNLNRPQQ